MPVPGVEEPLGASGDLFASWNFSDGENVFLDPGILGMEEAFTCPDGM